MHVRPPVSYTHLAHPHPCPPQQRGQGAEVLLGQQLRGGHQGALAPLLGRAGVRVGLLTGSVKGKARKELYAALAAGEVDLVVGTHALLSEDVYKRQEWWRRGR